MLWTIHAAAEALRSGRLTPRQLLDACFEQIERHESRVRAWVFVDRELAVQQAEAATAELRQGHWRGPLHGIPIGVKDIFDVFDWPTANAVANIPEFCRNSLRLKNPVLFLIRLRQKCLRNRRLSRQGACGV